MAYKGKYDHITGRDVSFGKKYKEYLREEHLRHIPKHLVEILFKIEKKYGKK